MEFTAKTLDDLMNDVLSELLSQSLNITVTKGILIGEINGCILRLTNPKARISTTETRGKPFSALGELLWYLSKDNQLDFISYYIDRYTKFSDDGETVYGGYGPRLFNWDKQINQFENIFNLLKKKPSSRQAVIQIFKAEDVIGDHRDIPCTCNIQFLIRDEKLSMVVHMRSNDAYMGLPHDIFCFTMLQEIMSKLLKKELGEYIHIANNLHLYNEDQADAHNYISEGYQSTKTSMPDMPDCDVLESIDKLLLIEKEIRHGKECDFSKFNLNKYWLDLAWMLKFFSNIKNGEINQVRAHIHEVNSIYKPYIEKRLKSLENKMSNEQ